MQTYWLFSVIERAKSTNADKIVQTWEGDTYRMANGKVIKMRACDHKAIQDSPLKNSPRRKVRRLPLLSRLITGSKNLLIQARYTGFPLARFSPGWTRNWIDVKERAIGENSNGYGRECRRVKHVRGSENLLTA